MMSDRKMIPLDCPTMMRSESKKLNSLRETTFVTSSHVAATAAIHVITKSLPSYGKSLKKEKHQKIDKIQPCQVQSLARLHALTCDDDACGAEEQKYCYECCPAPNKKQETPT